MPAVNKSNNTSDSWRIFGILGCCTLLTGSYRSFGD